MTKKIPPRKVPDRDSFYMGKAFIEASKSKDPKTQIGSIIISKENKPLASGYNGPPENINDNAINWDRPVKYPYIRHSEANSIDHCHNRTLLKEATIYVTAAPCKACMLDIVAAKIKRVVYFRPKADAGSLLSSDEEWKATRSIAKLAKVKLEDFNGNLNWLKDKIKWMESIGVFN